MIEDQGSQFREKSRDSNNSKITPFDTRSGHSIQGPPTPADYCRNYQNYPLSDEAESQTRGDTGEEEIYVDMRSTPSTHRRANSFSSSNPLPVRSPTLKAERLDAPITCTEAPATHKLHFDKDRPEFTAIRSPSNSYSSHDQGDYADMSGVITHSRNHSPIQSERRPRNIKSRSPGRSNETPRAKITERTTFSKQTLTAQRSRSQSNIVRESSMVTPTFVALANLENKNVISPRRITVSANIMEGGFNKDDDDDYTDYQTMSSNEQVFHKMIIEPPMKPLQAPNLKARPSSAKNVFHSTSLTSLSNQVTIPSKRFGFSDSSEEEETACQVQRTKKNKSNFSYRSKSVNDCKLTRLSTSSQEDILNKQETTEAGRAARKYLQHSDTRLSPIKGDIKRSPSIGISRSTSRAGKKGGVVSRITKIRQNNSSKNLTFDGDIINHSKPDFEQTEQMLECVIGDSTNSANHQRQQSNTFDRELVKGPKLTDSDTTQVNRQPLDGSLLIKFLASDAQSQTVDKKYVEWLAKTSPYASRHSSTSGKPDSSVGNCQPPTEIKSPDYTSDDDCDNVSFTKFTKDVTHNYRLRFASESTPEPKTSQNNVLFLGQYAEKHSKVIETKSPYSTEKSRDSVEKDIKALKTAMTLKPTPRSDNVEFADLAEAFYKDYKKDIQKKTKKDSKAEKKSKDKKSISLRRSFRFGSKKKLSDSPSDSLLNFESIFVNKASPENTPVMSTQPVETSNLKPPIGISPNHTKTDSLSRERSSSSSSHETRYNARENLNKVQTLEKGAALSHSLASPVLPIRGGSLIRDDPVFQSSDWQSNLRNATSISKSSTLGRLFSKKGKERRGLDVTDSSSNLFKPNGLQLENFVTNSKKGTTEINRILYDNLTQSQRYFQLSNLYRGIVVDVNLEKDETDGADIFFSNHKRHSLSTTPPINKYATITGSYFHQTTTSSINQNSLARHLSSDPIIHAAKDETTRENRRNKKKRSSLRGLSLTFSGNLPKIEGMPPVSKKEKSDVTTKDKTELAPLRSRQRHKVYPLYTEARPRSLATARLIYQHLMKTQPNLLRKHNTQEESDADLLTYGNDIHEHCAFGHELVTWLLSRTQPKQQMMEDRILSTSVTATKLRWNTCGMWQILQEEGLINHVSHERYFEDSSYLYQFHNDVSSYMRQDNGELSNKHDSGSTTSSVDSGISQVNGEFISEDFESNSRSSSIASSTRTVTSETSQMILNDIDLTAEITYLQQNAPDALFRMALRKRPEDRSSEELMMIYEEILHINALAHLSDSIKRELAGVLQFEHYQDSGITLFKQGDEGTSWYIVLRGSVDVVIYGKGVVCTLREGDDFGNLAIVNDAPRAASILLAEKNCQFLRVDKFDFVRILKDVEANTVRLKEHGSDVLILQKIPARSVSSPRSDVTVTTSARFVGAATPTRHNHRYSISAGTPEKILEHILEYVQPWNIGRREESMEDFIILHPVFISTSRLCELLINHYRSENVEHVECTRSMKRKIIYFTVRWSHITTYIFKSDPSIQIYVKKLKDELQLDMLDNSSYCVLGEDINCLFRGNETDEYSNDMPAQTLMRVGESLQRFSPFAPHEQTLHPVKANDQILLKVYNLQKTYTTVMISISAKVEQIVQAVAEKLNRPSNDLILVELQEDGETYVVTKSQTSIATSLKVNSRLFICTAEEKSSLSSFCFSNPNVSSLHLEIVSSLEVAYHVTKYDWELLTNVHVMEFVYKVFGAHKYNGLTSNLDIFTRRFNQLAYWAPTEICSCQNLHKRVQLLRKFIKIAQHLKMYQNLNGFMAIMIGIGNQAVSRLSTTWEKLPNKYKKLVQEYESILDPSRNHRSYRIHVSALQAPVILYLPLLLKDMTFQHEGNDSTKNGLVNFEKMRMISSSIRTVIQGCPNGIDVDSILETSKTGVETRNYVRKPQVITDQKLLNALSNQLEPRR